MLLCALLSRTFAPFTFNADFSFIVAQIRAVETSCLHYLRDLSKLPFYPSTKTDCAGDKAYFCATMSTMKEN